MEHVILAQDTGMFCGWPANNGIWSWGNEILVGYKKGVYAPNPKTHSIDRSQPQIRWLARSMDGGRSWSQELPAGYNEEEVRDLSKEIDFSHPDFTMRCNKDSYRVSYDRGKSWQGPFPFTGLEMAEKLSVRTDYLVSDSMECTFFLSMKEPRVEAGLQDRSFCARTNDGGKTFRFLSWMSGEPIEDRSVMSSTIRIDDLRLVTALRRRRDSNKNGQALKHCWVDVYGSYDNGESWQHFANCGNTDDPERPHNGNPPSLIRHPDGRLALIYGYRSPPLGMRVKISGDDGRTWSEAKYLRDDARTWDFGYPKSTLLPDGRVFTAYYYTTDADPEQHIAGTIWSLDELK